MQSKAATVKEYLAELPEERRVALTAICDVIRKNLDKEFEEGMQYGMIGFYVPHSVYPPGYHCDPKQPLPFCNVASQKNHISVYLMPVYGDQDEEDWFRREWEKTGKKLDMGKCCVRFKKLEDAALDVIGEAIRRVSARRHIEYYESVIKGARAKTGKTATSKTVAKATDSKTKEARPVSKKASSKATSAKSPAKSNVKKKAVASSSKPAAKTKAAKK